MTHPAAQRRAREYIAANSGTVGGKKTSHQLGQPRCHHQLIDVAAVNCLAGWDEVVDPARAFAPDLWTGADRCRGLVVELTKQDLDRNHGECGKGEADYDQRQP